MIEVCCAIILKGSKILAVQRGPESSHPWKWEFPGGKMHSDETAEQCIIREIEEELSVRIEIDNQLSAVEFDYGSKQIQLIPFVCRIVSGEVLLTEHVAQRWFDFAEWERFDWSGANYTLMLRNEKSLKKMLL